MNAGTRNSLDGDIVQIRRGLAIYKVKASPFYKVRILNPLGKPKYVVRSTKERSRIQARIVAEELAAEITKRPILSSVNQNETFGYYARVFLKNAKQEGERGVRSSRFYDNERYILENRSWGLLNHFEKISVKKIGIKSIADFIRNIIDTRPDLSASTHGKIRATFRNVMKVALMDGTIDAVPSPPKLNKGKQTARPFFRFSPLVNKEHDQYRLILSVAKQLAQENHVVRNHKITDELRDIILFLTHTFVRPISSELYSLMHEDITIEENPDRLLLTIKRGKTGYRVSTSTKEAVPIYKRIKNRNEPLNKPSDFLFLPSYKNRETAARIIMRQFSYLLKQAKLEIDPYTDLRHSLYSCRHTSLVMRMINSDGAVNMEILARNAGTSQEMLSNFYLKYLPMTRELAKNLQSMGARNED
jgi:hypothetical protein